MNTNISIPRPHRRRVCNVRRSWFALAPFLSPLKPKRFRVTFSCAELLITTHRSLLIPVLPSTFRLNYYDIPMGFSFFIPLSTSLHTPIGYQKPDSTIRGSTPNSCSRVLYASSALHQLHMAGTLHCEKNQGTSRQHFACLCFQVPSSTQITASLMRRL